MITDIRIAFFDLDDTLLAKDHTTVTERTQRALRKMRENGILLAVATGRSRAHLPDGLKLMPFDYYVTSNGADIIDLKSKEHIYTNYIPQEDAAIAWNLLKPHHLFVEWYTGNEVGIDEATHKCLNSFTMPIWHMDYFSKGTMPVFETAEQYIEGGAKQLEKINLPRFDPHLREMIWNDLDSRSRYTLSSSSGRNIEINRRGCTKGHAIRALCGKLNLSVTQAMAFGDGGNDVEMLETVGLGIAMANGTEPAKKAARAIAEPSDQDGVALYIERIIS